MKIVRNNACAPVGTRAQLGMAMLEVLIAMLVAAIAMLPLTLLQIQSDRGVMAAYTKVEHNAAALSIMDLITADANRRGWVGNVVSNGNYDNWRSRAVNNVLVDILPVAGSGLSCITLRNIGDGSLEMSVELWWFSAGRGDSAMKNKSKKDAFTANDCNSINNLADKWNIDTVKVTRIF